MVKYSAALPLVVCTVPDSERAKFDEFRTFLCLYCGFPRAYVTAALRVGRVFGLVDYLDVPVSCPMAHK
jgi:hypothetical protein